MNKLQKITAPCFDITDGIDIVESKKRVMYIDYVPRTTNLNTNGEFQISLENRDLFPLISESYLTFDGTILKADATQFTDANNITLNNNGILFDFDSITYKIGTMQVESISKVGICSLMKGLLTYPYGFSKSHGLLQFYSIDSVSSVANMVVDKIIWIVPVIDPNPEVYGKLLQSIKSKSDLLIGFLGRQLEKNIVPQTTSFRWDIRSSLGVVRYLIIGFQTDRENDQEKNKAIFDHCNLTLGRVKLNSVEFTCIKECDFANNNYMNAYKCFQDFHEKHYGTVSEVTPALYKSLYPLFVFDVSAQPEKLKDSAIDLVFEAEFSKNVPANTQVYGLILYDKFIKLSSDGEKQIAMN